MGTCRAEVATLERAVGREAIVNKFTDLSLAVLGEYGGEALRGFGLALIVGILVVTYSSMYVASGVALDLGANRRDLMPAERRGPVDEMP